MIFFLYKALLATFLCCAFWHWFIQPQIKYFLADLRELKRLLKKPKEEDNE